METPEQLREILEQHLAIAEEHGVEFKVASRPKGLSPKDASLALDGPFSDPFDAVKLGQELSQTRNVTVVANGHGPYWSSGRPNHVDSDVLDQACGLIDEDVGDPGSPPSSAADALRAMVEMFNSGDVSAVECVVSDSYLDHQGLGNGPLRGVSGFVDVVEASRSGFESRDVVILDIFGTYSRAVARIRWTGRRHDGEEVERETIDIVRTDRGMAVEHWGAHS